MKCIYKTDTNPKELVKYFNDSDSVINGIFKDHKIRFTQPAALNDPLELNPILRFPKSIKNPRTNYELNNKRLPSLEFFSRTHLIESVMNAYGIFSLSTQIDSYDMWNIYANGHKGFMIQFKDDFNEHKCFRSKNGNKIYRIGKVTYVDSFSIEINDIVTESNLGNFEYIYEDLFFTKNKRWSYENEYRIVRDLNDQKDFEFVPQINRDQSSIYLFDFSLDCIDSIVFGAQMSIEKRIQIVNACKNSDINFFQSYILKDEVDSQGKMGCVKYFQFTEDGPIRLSDLENYRIEQLCLDTDTLMNIAYPTKINNLSEYPFKFNLKTEKSINKYLYGSST